MLTKEENDLLTQTGPGTPMGELFRRFWLPALLSEEIPGADCPPVRVKLLSENLIAFRDTNGAPGLLDAYCPHRGAPLFFGRNEECGLRCVYHGWKFDVNGVCLDVPNSPEGEAYKDKVNITAYPAYDAGGIIWAYLGPKDKLPPYPEFIWLDFGEDRRYVRKYHLRCNYLQAMEGDYDPSHPLFLHSTLDNNASNPGNRIRSADNRPALNRFTNRKYVDYIDTDYGQMHVSVNDLGNGKQMAFIGTFFMPSFSSAGVAGPGVYSSNLRVPRDDENTYMYRLRWSYEPFTQQQVYEDRHGGYTFPEQIPGTFISKENKDNNYLVDRIAQKNISFTGIKSFPIQDQAVVEDQWGAIVRRDLEHLVSADELIIQVRRRLMKAATELMEGQEPAAPHNPAAFRVHGARVTMPSDVPIEEAIEHARSRMATINAPLTAL